MSESTAILFISAIVNKEHASEVPGYLGSVMQVFGKNGGKPIARYKGEGLVGDDSPEMMAVIEFANADTIRNMVSGDDFTALADLRARVFSKLNMTICEGM